MPALLAAACGGAPPPAAHDAPVSPVDASPRASQLTTNAEIGALDERKTNAAFNRAGEQLTSCFARGTERITYLAGDAEFYVRVASDGNPRYVYLADSTLGDRDTEACMLDVLKRASFPAPIGGNEGIAKRQMHFEPGGDERPPVRWSPAQLGASLDRASAALSRCAASAETGPMKATMYIETDGKPASVGVSVSDEKGEKAVGCVVEVLRQASFASPGSYASKVTIEIH
jgi:hypothetical protein